MKEKTKKKTKKLILFFTRKKKNQIHFSKSNINNLSNENK